MNYKITNPESSSKLSLFGLLLAIRYAWAESGNFSTGLNDTMIEDLGSSPEFHLRDNMCSESRPCSPSGCCSKFGNCGFTPEHCGQGCKSGCSSKQVAGVCSKTKPCSPAGCCSEFGVCGFSEAHCGPGCVSGCSSKPPPMECSASQPCRIKACCSKFGSCGFGPKFCDSGCLRDCDAKPECGQFAVPAGKLCPLKVCCSKFGFCGTTTDFCTNDCQSGCVKPSKPSCGSHPTQYRIGYYASWASERVCEARLPEDIDAKSYTHLNYAFGRISNGLMIDPTGKETQLFSSFTSLKKSNAKLKVLVSVGGWAFNDPGQTRNEFHNIISSPSSRSRFIQSVLIFMKKYNFDGLDVDYEYPTAMDRGGFPTDTDDYLSLIQEMKQTFGGRYLLTIASPASYWYLKNFKIGEMSKSLDWINLMTYDFHGVWNKDSMEFGNIVRSHTDIQSIREGLDLLFRDGVKPDKIALGLGTYGRSYTLENPACRSINNCRFRGPGQPGRCTREPGILSLFEIEEIRKAQNVEPIHDRPTASQILTFNHQWISYDSEKTLNDRISLAKEYCLRGTMIWSVDMDNTKSKGSRSKDSDKKWQECTNEADCCGRSEAFCVDCQDGCFYMDVLSAPAFSGSERLLMRKEGLSFPQWMTELPDKLRLSEMSIPGTHDSGARDVSLFKAPRFAQTQSLTIKEQLVAGIRALDVRCRHIDNKFTIHHGPIYLNLNFDDVLRDVTSFLGEHPGEVVLMRVKEEHNAEKTTRSFADTLQDYIDQYSKFFWKSTTMPTLGKARGKIVILDNTPKSPGFGPFWNTFQIQDNYDFSGQGCCRAGILQGCFSEPTCGPDNRIPYKWGIVKDFFQTTAKGSLGTVYINFLSANAIPDTSPAELAKGKGKVKGMNERAKDFLSPSNREIGRAGWVFMDFPGPSIIYSILFHN